MAKDPKKPALTTQGEILQEAKELKRLLENIPQIGTPKVLEGLDKYGEHVRKAGADLEALSAHLVGLREQMEEASKGTTDATAALQGLDLQSELLITRLTGVRKATNATFIEAFGQALKNTKSLGAAMGQMAETAQETFTTWNVGIAMARKFAEGTALLTMSLESATAGFAKATGTGNKYKDVIRAAEFRNRRYGISADDAAKATGALVGGFSEFLMMSEDAQKNLTTTVSSFEAIGVNAETTVKFLEAVTRTTGKTGQEAERLQKSIMGTAKAFGDDLNKVMEETAALMPKLAIHGNNMERVLDNLYSASKRTGFAMGDIVGMAEQFDTFDTAADAAGNLNAVLGQMGGAPLIDTMQILEETDPAKRMQLFSDAIEQSVGNFEDLGYYQQRAIANAMGLGVEETRRLMLQEEETSAMDAALAKRGLGEEEMLEMQKQGRDLMIEMKILAMQFAVALQPAVDALKFVIGGMSDLLGKFPKGFMGGVGKLIAGGTLAVAGAWITGKAIRGMLSRLVSVPQMAALNSIAATSTSTSIATGKMATDFTMMMIRQGLLPGRSAAGIRGATPRILPPTAAAGASTAAIAGGVAAGFAGFAMAKMAWDTVQAEKDVAKKKKRGMLGALGLGAGGLLGAGLLGLGVLSGPLGWGVMAALAGGGALAGAHAGGMAEGGIVTRPTPTVVGEGGQNEAVVPLPNGRSIPVSFGGGDGGFNALSAKLDKVIAAIENNVPVLVKGDLEAAGFMQGSRVAVS